MKCKESVIFRNGRTGIAPPPYEKTYVKIPFIDQLNLMGWGHIKGDLDVQYLTERESFRGVLPTGRLKTALNKINLDDKGAL